MRRIMCACFAALVAVAIPIAAQQETAEIRLSGKGAQGVTVRVIKDGQSTTLGTTDANGVLGHDPNALFTKNTPLVAYAHECPNGTEIILMPEQNDDDCPPGCKCRRLGVVIWGRRSNLRLSGNFFSSPLGLGVLGGAGAAAGLLAAGGGSSNNPGTTPGTNNPGGGSSGGGGTTPPPAAPSPNSFNGTWNGTASAAANGCGFLNSTPVRGVLNVNGAGAGTWVNTHVTQNQVYNFEVGLTVTGNQGAFNATSTSNPWGYVVVDNVTFSGNTATGTQTFRDPSRGNCETRYNLNFTKQQ